jgi:hypothetical protein
MKSRRVDLIEGVRTRRSVYDTKRKDHFLYLNVLVENALYCSFESLGFLSCNLKLAEDSSVIERIIG